MKTAVLQQENLPNFAPVTNHYRCSDGTWLLVSIDCADLTEFDSLPILGGRPILHTVCADTVVYLADETATVIDADGNPANGLTPIARFDDCDTHADALGRLGYTIAVSNGVSICVRGG